MKNKIAIGLTFVMLLPSQVFALPFPPPIFEPIESATTKIRRVIPTVEAQELTINCQTEVVDKPVYSGSLVSIVKKDFVAPTEFFETKMYFENTGNVTWFSEESGCTPGRVMNLGTQQLQDRNSILFTPSSSIATNWVSPSRIKMTTPKVSPGQTAEFTFWSQAPQAEGVYREYFAPVIENVSWIKGKALVSFDTQVGFPQYTDEMRSVASFIEESTNLADPKYTGEKSLHVDLSEQKLRLKIGNTVVKIFPVSSGTYKYPTPVGKTRITLKQPVRVGFKKPHYIMPLFMMFRSGGYGFHALPSLANDRGVFWREALNHIGTPRSHGCIRLLPQDAQVAYDFTSVGTLVEVVR